VAELRLAPLAALVLGGALLLSSDQVAGDEATSHTQVAAGSDDWPCWRGPTRDNHSSDEAPPLRWGVDRGIAWKSPVPGRGHASPCVVGSRIFIASADEAEGTQFLLAFDRQNGAQLWRTEIHRGSLPTINEKNSHASATPACDGRYVFVVFAQAEHLSVTAVDLAGRIVWHKIAGKYKHGNGLGASPVLYGNSVIVASDSPVEPSLVALAVSDGTIQWRAKRTASSNSATPIVGIVAGRPQLLINGAYSVNSYDPATGKVIWHVAHKTEVVACTMAFDAERVFASGNVPEPCMLAVRGDGSGDVTDTHVLWKTKKSITYVPSPLLVGEYLFVVTDAGIAFCREANTGKVIWKHRLGGSFLASPVFAGGNIYATSEAGVMHVFRAAPEYQAVAENDIKAPCLATPAICDGHVFLRTDSHLYCIGGDDTR
jgi:outer membrane protein assembly factor BamB